MHLEPVSIEEQQNPFASALEPVWEKVRAAAVLIASLRQEKKQLEERIEGLEDEVRRSSAALAGQTEELARLKAEFEAIGSSGRTQVQCPAVLGTEERLQLQQKIKTALSKIDTYLSAS
jgi:chromosome segregation ATPase